MVDVGSWDRPIFCERVLPRIPQVTKFRGFSGSVLSTTVVVGLSIHNQIPVFEGVKW